MNAKYTIMILTVLILLLFSSTVQALSTETSESNSNVITATLTSSEEASGLADTAWPKFQGNLQNTGQSSYIGPQTSNLLWTYSTGGHVGYIGSATIGPDGSIYVGSRDAKLYALNPNGTLKWSYATGDDIRGSPTIGSDGTIYVGSDDYKLYALNPNGTLKWSYATGSLIFCSPAIGSDGTIYVGSYDSNIYALNPNGTLKWSFATGSRNYGSPAIGSDGTIYVGSLDKNIYALNPNGTLKWEYTASNPFYGALAIGSDGTLYIGSKSGILYALNPNGTLKWSYRTDYVIEGSPAIASDGTIYIGSWDNNLYALNPNGTLKWKYATGDRIYFGSPAIGADGTVYVGSRDSYIYALSSDGTLKWRYPTGGSIYGATAIGADGTLYIGSEDCNLYAFRDEEAPVADFTADPTSGNAPLTVRFTDNSTNPPAFWAWDFGDGNSTNSKVQNPMHTYAEAGTYNVTLTVTNSVGSDEETKIGYITVTTEAGVEAPVANFTAFPTSGNSPLTVSFTDFSSNSPASWSWDFGDGDDTNATLQNPVHTYIASGTYNVTLTATNIAGSDTDSKTEYIIVIPGESAPVASFTSDSSSGRVPFTVQFTDTTTGNVTVWSWDFGDGVTSNEQNPVHTYVTEGTHTVTLAATGPGGTTEENATMTVDAPLNTGSYDGGTPLLTVQEGNVSGGLWHDSYTGFSTSAVKNFTLPAHTEIKWARLYTDVYCGIMYGGGYAGKATIDIDADGDGIYERRENETLSTSYFGAPAWVNDHVNRVTSDYLIWYDLTDEITESKVNVKVSTSKIDPSFDGRIKHITLVVAYDDGDTDEIHYWVNQGHDTANTDSDIGSTEFDTSAFSGSDAVNLTSIYCASTNGAYTFNGASLSSGRPQGDYFGYDDWNVSEYFNSGEDSTLTYTNVGGYYKIQIALLAVSGAVSSSREVPVAGFTSTPTSGSSPLIVAFTDESTNSPTSWAWDFDNDGIIDSTEQSPSYTYTSAGNYTVNLTVENLAGTDSEVKTDYIVVSSQEIQDTTKPVIDSVVLFPANTTAGATINLSINATDNIGITEVTAGEIQLTNTDGVWQGSITAPSSLGNYSLSINASDAAGNTAETSVPYHVVQLSGGANIAVSPRSSSAAAGNTVSLYIKVKNTQNIDDTFKVRISVSELPASYQADLSWFEWTDKVVSLKAGEEVLIPMEVTVPSGTATGYKLFRANVNSETFSIAGFDTGYLIIS